MQLSRISLLVCQQSETTVIHKMLSQNSTSPYPLSEIYSFHPDPTISSFPSPPLSSQLTFQPTTVTSLSTGKLLLTKVYYS